MIEGRVRYRVVGLGRLVRWTTGPRVAMGLAGAPLLALGGNEALARRQARQRRATTIEIEWLRQRVTIERDARMLMERHVVDRRGADERPGTP